MPFYSREICEEVRARNDIVDVISSYIKLEKRGGRYFGVCPFHTEKTPSFSVSSQMQLFHCFGCHESGNVISFVMKYENVEFTEAVEMLASRVGMEITSSQSGGEEGRIRRRNEELLGANKAAAEYFYRLLRSEDGERGRKYFNDRGLSKEIAKSFGLGFSGMGHGLHEHLTKEGFSDEIQKEAGLIIFDEKQGIRDRFFNRVMFPIMDINNKVIAFGGRVMGDGQPKYLNSAESPIFNKSRTLYGMFAARKTRRNAFILCEGYMDVISAHQAGFDNCIATLGTALTEGHASILRRYKRPVILCYDSDTAGRAAAVRGYDILKNAGISVRIMDLSPYKDPDEIIKAKGKEEFEKRISDAKNAFLVIQRWEYEKIDTNDPDAVTAFNHTLAGKISSFTDESERETYISFAAKEFGIKSDILRRIVNNTGVALYAPPPVKPQKGKSYGIKKEEALTDAEGMLIYFLLDKEFFLKCRGFLERDDFTDEDYKGLFDLMIEANEDKVHDPADFINNIQDEEKKTHLSKCFFSAGESQQESAQESNRIRKNTLLRVKKAALKRASANIDPTDVEKLQLALEYARDTIEEIEKL